MQRKRLFWQLYPSYLFVVFMALAIISLFTIASFHSLFFAEKISALEVDAKLLAPQVGQLIQAAKYDEIQSLVKRLGEETKIRISVALAKGRVVGDSTRNLQEMDNFLENPEVAEALARGRGVSRRMDYYAKSESLFLTIPLYRGSEHIGFLRLALPLEPRAFWSIYLEILGGGLALALIVAVLGWFYTRRIALPLEVMRDQAESIARGGCSGVATTSLSVAAEIEGLGRAINELAFQLNSRMQTIQQQRSEEEAILSSMVEGVVAVNNHSKILNMNQAAADMLQVEKMSSMNKAVEEVIRIPRLQKFIRRVLAGSAVIDEELALGETERFLQVHVNSLRDPEGREIGALLVFSDISRMRQLESHRRDFVANVSHELRTPLTSIKGFLETLKDGALDDPVDSRRFLDIALKHTDRLNAIIDDLLKLSRLEKETENSEITLTHGSIRKVLDEAIQLCEVKSRQKEVVLRLECPPGLQALINPPLLEQAVVNLIDNAVKFSDAGTEVLVRGKQEGIDVVISVEDKGVGISPEHLPRIFERFYRVDKARSRSLGGTGLGLAIVKHVALAHRGVAEVRSQLGRGSEFSLRLRSFT